MKRLLVILVLLATPALAEPAKPDPAQQALGQMLAEAQVREAQALIQVYSLRARIADLEHQLATAAGEDSPPAEVKPNE